jgi:enoyl-CoA hydratase
MTTPETGPTTGATAAADPERQDGQPGLIVARAGAATVLTLNRASALNAVTTGMRTVVAAALAAAARDPDIYVVILKAAGARAFCAGGDLRELAGLVATDTAAARRSLAEEYALNWRLECFSKPHVSLIDGLVVGSGVGLSLYGTHRVAGPGYSFAMPETAIGLFPDDGVIHVFSRMPGGVGAYLALTGRRIGRADALALGLVTHCVPEAAFQEIERRLALAEPVDRVLDGLHQEPGLPPLNDVRVVIDRCFTAATVATIMRRLEAEQGGCKPWAQAVHAELATRAPLSLAVTLRHLQAATAMDLRQTLMMDYRLAARCLSAPDFAEGVRAALIDKDHAPRWSPQRLEEVTPGMVDRYFRVEAEDELLLPTRQEMQAGRG